MQQLKHDTLAEQGLLGSMLIDSSIITPVVSEITSEFFYNDSLKYIFKAIAYLNSKRIEVDIITLKSQLEKFKVFDMVGGVGALTDLVDATPTSSNRQEYVRIITECYQYRQITNIMNVSLDSIGKNESPIDIINNLYGKINIIISKDGKHETKKIGELLYSRYDELADMVENRDKIKNETIYTGYKGLDNLTGGFKKGNLCIIAGRPGMCKTTFALNITDYNIKHGKRVVFFSLEMSETEITDRLISIYSGVNGFKLRTGLLGEKDLNDISKTCDTLTSTNLEIDASPMLTPLLLKNKLLQISNSGHIDLVVIDYLGLMKEPGEKNRVQEISEISRQLKLFAKEFQVPIIALSQLSRSVESRPNKVPIMSDLRDSGSIEQDADQLLFLYRDEVYDEFTDKKNKIEVYVRKNRHGGVGDCMFYFYKARQRIYNIKNGNIIDENGIVFIP